MRVVRSCLRPDWLLLLLLKLLVDGTRRLSLLVFALVKALIIGSERDEMKLLKNLELIYSICDLSNNI